MHSKISKARHFRQFLWKFEQNCAEDITRKVAFELAAELTSGDRVILEGEMGAGKTTFARALLKGLGVNQPPEGSPSFAIAHEYQAPGSEVVHLDLYRLKSEAEVEAAGVHSYYWERDAIVVSEWLSMFPDLEKSVLEDSRKRYWLVQLRLESESSREIEIFCSKK